MHIYLALFLVLSPVFGRAPGTETPVLNIFSSTRFTQVEAGEQITYQADVYFTSDEVDTLHAIAILEPWKPLAIGAVVYDKALGTDDCVLNLFQLNCKLPIKRFSPVSLVAVVDAPDYISCFDTPLTLKVSVSTSTLTNTLSIPVLVKATRKCYYFPWLANTSVITATQ